MSISNKVLIVSLVFVSPCILLLWMLVKLLTLHSQLHYRYLNELLFATYMRVFLFFFEFISVRKINIYGDVEYSDHRDDKVLYISNHLSSGDWFLCSMLIARQGNIGRTRYVLYKNLKYIPIFGFYLSQDGFLFVDRSNFRVNKAIEMMRRIQRWKSKAWMIIYPEGRRYNPEHVDVIKQSTEYAKEQGIKPFLHHLNPRFRGFHLLMDNMRTYLDAVYDICVVFADADGRPLDHQQRVPQMHNWLRTEHSLHIHITRIPIESIPREEKALHLWLYERFRIKDEFVENLQRRFYPDKETPSKALHHNGDLSNGHLHHSLPLAQKTDYRQDIMECLPTALKRAVSTLPPLNLSELLPSIVLFYGLTFWWIFGFGWYGPLSYIMCAIFGSLLGMVYVHYYV